MARLNFRETGAKEGGVAGDVASYTCVWLSLTRNIQHNLSTRGRSSAGFPEHASPLLLRGRQRRRKHLASGKWCFLLHQGGFSTSYPGDANVTRPLMGTEEAQFHQEKKASTQMEHPPRV